MTSAIRAHRENEAGFTLIELLVVVIIIGILAAIAIPAFLNQRERAYVSASESDARNAAIAMETAFTASDEYPQNFTSVPAQAYVVCDGGVGAVAVVADDGDPATDDCAGDPQVAQFVTSDNVTMTFVNNTTQFEIATDHLLRDANNSGLADDDVDACYLSAQGGITDVVDCATADAGPAAPAAP